MRGEREREREREREGGRERERERKRETESKIEREREILVLYQNVKFQSMNLRRELFIYLTLNILFQHPIKPINIL